jgi:hypothetical protein
MERIAAVGGVQDAAATRQDAAHVFERELVRFFRPDQAIEAIGDAHDLPSVFQEGALHGGADYRVEAGGISTSRADADAANVRQCF